MNKELKPSSREPEPHEAVIGGTSPEGAADLLFKLLIEVVRRHEPKIEPILTGSADIAGFPPGLLARSRRAALGSTAPVFCLGLFYRPQRCRA